VYRFTLVFPPVLKIFLTVVGTASLRSGSGSLCHFDASPDPTFRFDAVTDTIFPFDADTDLVFYWDEDPKPDFLMKVMPTVLLTTCLQALHGTAQFLASTPLRLFLNFYGPPWLHFEPPQWIRFRLPKMMRMRTLNIAYRLIYRLQA
jgi:hypothetical protein